MLTRQLGLTTCLCALLYLSIVTSTGAYAKEDDLKQPIDVRADKSEFDEKAGLQTLSGNVEITQGTLRILADSISIALKNNALHTITGTGTPIEFRQENDSGELMVGEAKRISYNATNGTLTLEGAAKLTKPRQNLVSERITFDARTQKVSAEGGGETGRVNIQILPPESGDNQ